MPSCCLIGCRNRGEKGYRLFGIPTAKNDDQRKKAWVAFINRDDLPERAMLCEAHFEMDQFELNRADNRKLLKRNAVPTIKTPPFSQNQGIKRKRSDPSGHMSTSTSPMSVTQEQLQTSSTVYSDISTIDGEPEENDQLKRLQNEIRAGKARIAALEKQISNLEENCKTLFSEDQIHFLKYGNHRGKEWSDETVQKALKLYMACGKRGYEELCRQKFPLPAIRTLQNRIANLKFQPGLLNDIFELLKMKMMTFEEHERHAALLLDEMAIQPSLQYDNSTKSVIGRPTMLLSGNLDSSNELASHALVFMLAGMSTRWKQTIGYELTAKSYSADEVLKKLFECIKRADDAGVKVKTIISDMGPLNRSFWRQLHITASRHTKIVNFCPHPLNNEEKLYIMPDPVHVFKNLAISLISHKFFQINLEIQTKYQLPNDRVDIGAIKQLFDLDNEIDLKVAPRLEEHMFHPSHFAKMDVGTAYALLHHDTGAGFEYFIAKGKMNPIHATTAWFCKTAFKWFKVITSRDRKLAWSYMDGDMYESTVHLMNEFMKITYGIHIGGKPEWKPVQTGIILSTKTALDIQEEYLNNYGYKYVMGARLTQDALENLFSVIRSRTPVPGPREFKVSLRLITLSQYECQIVRGNYDTDARTHLITYCKNKKNDTEEVNTGNISLEMDPDNTAEGSDVLKQSLYYMLGSLIHSLKISCQDCISALTNQTNQYMDSSILTHYKEFKENRLIYPKTEIFAYFLTAEKYFRQIRLNLIQNNGTFEQGAEIFMAKHILPISLCHEDNLKALVHIFFRTRFFFALKEFNKNGQFQANVIDRSSRSQAMRDFVKNVK